MKTPHKKYTWIIVICIAVFLLNMPMSASPQQKGTPGGTPTKARETGKDAKAPSTATKPADAAVVKPDPVNISMFAVISEKKPAVILRFSLGKQALPAAGFELYRKGPKEQLFVQIAQPLKPADSVTVPGVKGKPARLIKVSDARLDMPAQRQIFSRETRPTVATAQPVFDEFQQFHKNERMPFNEREISRPDQYKAINNYFQRFSVKPFTVTERIGLPSKPMTTYKPSAQEIESQKAMNTRTQLMIGASINHDISSKLGLGYTDERVSVGETYEYQLKANKQVVASCKITVVAGPFPAKPSGLSALQRDAKRVALRWALDQSQSYARVVAYNIFRTAAGVKTQLNAIPLLIGAIIDKSGNRFDPVFYFTDHEAPVGRLSYELVGVDSFGRTTPPATLDFVMADWETPQPVTKSSALWDDRGKDKVLLYWQRSSLAKAEQGLGSPPPTKPGDKAAMTKPDDRAMYNIYRCDEGTRDRIRLNDISRCDASPREWKRLNAAPIATTPAFTINPNDFKNPARKNHVRDVVTSKDSLCYIDERVEKDRYYKYTVVAHYQKNMMESPPGPIQTVGVPDYSLPAPPTNLAGRFSAKVMKDDALRIDPRWSSPPQKPKLIIKPTNLHKDPSEWKKVASSPAATAQGVVTTGQRIQTVTASGAQASRTGTVAAKSLNEIFANVIRATVNNSDLGSTVVLQWNAAPLTGPVRYKIYRANAAGFFPAQKKAAPQVGGLKGSVVQEGAIFEHLKNIPPQIMPTNSYTFIADTDKTSFTDYLPKSRPMYYNYRVTAVNRWGIEGQAALIQVRIAATMKPPIPELLSAFPNEAGGVSLVWRPLEEREDCAKYLVYRKKIDVLELLHKKADAVLGHPAFTTPAHIVAGDKTSVKTLKDTLVYKDGYNIIGEIPSSAIRKDDAGNVLFDDASSNLWGLWLMYAYTVVAQDVDTWQSDASKPQTTSPWKIRINPVQNLKAAADASGRGIALSWSAPANEPEIQGYVVFRQGSDSKYVQISDMIQNRTFTDYGIVRGLPYTYGIQALDKKGNLSAIVTCKLP